LTNSDFSISGFKRRKRRGFVPEADLGKRHNYPKKRKSPTFSKWKGPGKVEKGYQFQITYFKK